MGKKKPSQTDLEMDQLMKLPAFRKFLFRSIQSAGLLSPATNGSDGRNLDYYEGRRSLGFDLLRDAERAFPEPLQHPECLMTLQAIYHEETTHPPSENSNENNTDRYEE